jgi:DNA-binding MarR family transcriptional regulator
MTSNAVAAWGSILRVHSVLLPRLERAVFEQAGVTLAWYDVLLELNFAGGRLTMGQLGDRVVLSRSRVSRVVDELVAAELVSREANPDDKRSSFAALTARGRKRFLAVAKVYLPAIDREVGLVEDATLEQVAVGLNALLNAASKETGDNPAQRTARPTTAEN